MKIKKFWKSYTSDFSISYHKFYLSHNNFDVRYIPDDLYVSVIDPYFNDRKLHNGVCDKNYFDIWFKAARRPETILRVIAGQLYDGNYKLIDIENAISILACESEYVSKPALGSCGGANVMFHSHENSNAIRNFLCNLPVDNMVFQRSISQHKKLAAIHKNSVNTMRIMTLLFSGKVYFISAIQHMGIGNSRVDNAMHGGIFCAIHSDGSLGDVAFDQKGNKYTRHPSGFSFEYSKGPVFIPGFEKAVNMVVKEAEKMGHFRLISWDIAIGDDGEPILVEANLQMGDIDMI